MNRIVQLSSDLQHDSYSMTDRLPLRILWVSEVVPDPNSGAGGTEVQMVAGLRALGHQVDTLWADDLPRRIRHGNLHYAVELPQTYWQAVRQKMQSTTYDVVTLNLGQSFLTGEQLRKSGFEGAFIVRSHGLDDHLETVLAPWADRLGMPRRSLLRRYAGSFLSRIQATHLARAARCCDGYVVSTSLDAAWLNERHKLPADRIAVIPQAPAESFLKTTPKSMTAERARRLLYVANFNLSKGPHAVARVFQSLASSGPATKMTWISPQRDHAIVKDLLGRQASEQVEIVGWTSQEELVERFDNHGIFLYPSLFDGFGKVFLEAMSRGLCVVGCQAGGMVDAIRSGENGFLCPFNDSDDMLARVRELITDPQKSAAISKEAIQTSLQYRWHLVAQQLESFFRRRLAAKTKI